MRPLGTVTGKECEELKKIFQRKNALRELSLTFAGAPAESMEDNPFYEKLISDYMETSEKMSAWWKRVSAAYGWTYGEKDAWNLNFETCEVFLTTEE